MLIQQIVYGDLILLQSEDVAISALSSASSAPIITSSYKKYSMSARQDWTYESSSGHIFLTQHPELVIGCFSPPRASSSSSPSSSPSSSFLDVDNHSYQLVLVNKSLVDKPSDRWHQVPAGAVRDFKFVNYQNENITITAATHQHTVWGQHIASSSQHQSFSFMSTTPAIVGRVVDVDGQAVPDAKISISESSLSTISESPRSTISDLNGQYRISGLPKVVTVRATSNGFFDSVHTVTLSKNGYTHTDMVISKTDMWEAVLVGGSSSFFLEVESANGCVVHSSTAHCRCGSSSVDFFSFSHNQNQVIKISDAAGCTGHYILSVRRNSVVAHSDAHVQLFRWSQGMIGNWTKPATDLPHGKSWTIMEFTSSTTSTTSTSTSHESASTRFVDIVSTSKQY